MDMYKKREQRKNNKDLEKESSKTNINWLMETYGNTHSSPYKIRILTN